jgi:flagellar biosynthesis protein FlhG
MLDFYASSPAPIDQADGLRRLFAGSRVAHVAVAGNPRVPFAGVLLERLTAAFAALGRHALVVDATSGSPAAHELSWVDLGACVEPLSPEVSYLAARGLPLRHVDTRGCADSLLAALADAAPQAEVIVLHADAADLSRVFARRAVRPLLLAADHPASVTDAYASLKLLVHRNGCLSFDLLLAVDARSPRRERIAPQLADCADRFAGAALHDWAAVDPASDAADAPAPALLRLAAALLQPPDAPAPATRPARAVPPRHVPASAACRPLCT